MVELVVASFPPAPCQGSTFSGNYMILMLLLFLLFLLVGAIVVIIVVVVVVIVVVFSLLLLLLFPSCSVSRIDILRQSYDIDAVFCFLLVGVFVVVIVIVVLIVVSLWLRVRDLNSQAILGSCQNETDTFCAAGFTRIRRTPFATCPCHMDCRKLNQKNQNQIVGLSQQQQQNLVIVFSILHLFTNAPNKNTSYKSLDIIELCLRTED